MQILWRVIILIAFRTADSHFRRLLESAYHVQTSQLSKTYAAVCHAAVAAVFP